MKRHACRLCLTRSLSETTISRFGIFALEPSCSGMLTVYRSALKRGGLSLTSVTVTRTDVTTILSADVLGTRLGPTSSVACSETQLTTHDSVSTTTHDDSRRLTTTHDDSRRLTAHSSRLTAHGSRLKTHDSRLTGRDSCLVTHDS